MKKLLFIALFALLPISSAMAETKEIGSIMSYKGFLIVFVSGEPGNKEVVLSVVDKHKVNRVLLDLSPKDLDKLVDMLGQAKIESSK